MDSEELKFREMFPLVLVILGALAVLFLVAALLIGDSDDTYVPSGMTKAEVIAERVAPIGEVNMGGPVVAEASGGGGAMSRPSRASGQAVYEGVCSACHANGTLGAPVFGDTAAWEERAQKGMETLIDHSVNGFNQMPAQGGSASEEEIERAITYMLEEAGVSP
ncbi:MAG: c-type cytochrome [Halofilum sp. (in: g-proteobacteria)]|nr:c-type cytochrome [Halofilum sp. (in: g-proteobacteria)]